MATKIKYVSVDTAKVYKSSNENSVLLELLWGDRVEILSNTKVNGRYKVNARWAKGGFIKAEDLGDEALLEYYFIDVGQGDGVLIVTPDRRHILIDGGYTRTKQPHGKSAADFVDWKFYEEYKKDTIELDTMITSHNDADHYGGLWDMLNKDFKEELDTTGLSIRQFAHAGVSWWKSASNSRFLGNSKAGYLTDIIDSKTSIKNGLKENAALKLQGEWAEFLKCLVKTDTYVVRLSYNPDKGFTYLPGYEEGNDVVIKVLGPIEKTVNGKPGFKDFGDDSQNTNGHSILLRVDYKKSRVLLTGDLNQNSQHFILEAFEGNRQELAADVAKACHHGSDDCSIEFLQYVQAAATIISSGDDEKNAHPRPAIVAASGVTGFRKVEKDKLLTPLVYSTEISRSYRLGNPFKVTSENYPTDNGNIDIELSDEEKINVSYKHVASGALNGKKLEKTLDRLKVVDGIVYGLVNVRTDGNKILCATLNEGSKKWDVRTFYSRF